MQIPGEDNTTLEVGDNDPLLQEATEWITQQTQRASLTDLRLALNIDAAHAGAIIMAMQKKDLVKKSGFMPFPQFFEYNQVAAPIAPAPAPAAVPTVAPSRSSDPFAPAPILDSEGNEWTGNIDSSLSGRGRVICVNGDIEEGIFENGQLIEGERVFGGELVKGNIDKGKFRDGKLSKGRTTYADGNYQEVDMYEGNEDTGRGRKIYFHEFSGGKSTEEGEFDSYHLVKGKKVETDGVVHEGEFLYAELKKGRKSFTHENYCDIDMEEGNDYRGKGRKVWNMDGKTEIQEGDFDNGCIEKGKITKNPGMPDMVVIEGNFANGRLQDGTITHADGQVVNVVAGKADGMGDEPEAEPDAYKEPIKGIRENAVFGLVPKKKNAEAMRGIERIESLCASLPEDEQRLIGELHIKFKDRTPSSGGFFAKKPTKAVSWKAFDIQAGEGNTFVEIDPLRLPENDSEITQYLLAVAKKYANQRKAEIAIEDLKEESMVYALSINYDHGVPNFLNSLEGIEKIRRAMGKLNEDETGLLSRSNLLILMAGQKKEDYAGSKYRIILSCDTTLGEDGIASFLRGELRRVEQEGASPAAAPSRKPAKKSVPGIFSSTRRKLVGALAALALVGGGAVAIHQASKKPVPVDTKPAPAPKAPEGDKKASDEKKAPKEDAKPAEETVEKVDLSAIPVGGKVTFKTKADGIKMGVLVKNSRGKYQPVDDFDFDGDDISTVVRIQ